MMQLCERLSCSPALPMLAMTAYAALRLAFSMVNDALGAHPDWQFRNSTDPRGQAAHRLRATDRGRAGHVEVALGHDPHRVTREMRRRCRVNAQRTRRMFSSISMQ